MTLSHFTCDFRCFTTKPMQSGGWSETQHGERQTAGPRAPCRAAGVIRLYLHLGERPPQPRRCCQKFRNVRQKWGTGLAGCGFLPSHLVASQETPASPRSYTGSVLPGAPAVGTRPEGSLQPGLGLSGHLRQAVASQPALFLLDHLSHQEELSSLITGGKPAAMGL